MIARDADRLAELAEQIPDTYAQPCDVTDVAALKSVIRNVGQPNLVVHNAVGGAFGTFDKIDPETLARNFDINAMALFYLARLIGANWIVRQVMRLTSFGIRRKAKKRGIDYSFLFMRPDGEQLAKIAKLAELGVIRPEIDQEFAFEDTPAAMDRLATGRASGKLVIRGSAA